MFRTLLYEPRGLYLWGWSDAANKTIVYEYEDGKVEEKPDVDINRLNSNYPTYVQSPDGKRLFWSEQRDGRQAFFVGNTDAQDNKQVATEDEDAVVYGWYGNDYLLLSRKGSELYILPVAGGAPLKVADYHKPQLSYRGYGGGYGGL